MQLKDTAEAVLALVLGPGAMAQVRMPHPSTISRGKAKLDVALMLTRQHFWDKNIKKTSIQLGSLFRIGPLFVCVANRSYTPVY